MGGREFVQGEKGELEKGARPDSSNNFQARYAIRHAWTGPIACESPRRGIWGGPPSGGGASKAIAATDLASAPRAELKLVSHIDKGLDDVESWDEAAAKSRAKPAVLLGATVSSGETKTKTEATAEGGNVPAVPPRRACGCATPGVTAGWGLGVRGWGWGCGGVGVVEAEREKVD